MTWSFLYLAVLLVGTVLAAAIAVHRNDRHPRSDHRHLVLPHADHRGVLRNHVALRAAVALAAAGLAGLLANAVLALPPASTVAIAVAAGCVLALVGLVLFRPSSMPGSRVGRATAVRDIPPGGYGQVRVQQGDRTVILAAASADDRPIPAGADVEVFDCDRSVVRVRLVSPS